MINLVNKLFILAQTTLSIDKSESQLIGIYCFKFYRKYSKNYFCSKCYTPFLVNSGQIRISSKKKIIHCLNCFKRKVINEKNNYQGL